MTDPSTIFTSLDLDLMSWAERNFPECFVALADKLDDLEFVRKCLGAIVRRRAAADLGWLWSVAERDRAGLWRLTPYVKSIPAGGAFGPIPGPRGWSAWLADVELAEAL